MELFRAALLGIIQGLTEFLPVSSSGHLELAKFFLQDDSLAQDSLMMTVLLHFATACSTLIVFRKDVWGLCRNLFGKPVNESQRFSTYIIISMIPAAAVGILLESQIEALFNHQILLVAIMLIVTAILLFLADKAKQTDKKVGWKAALMIGVAQAVAIIPGISRSGATISTSVLLGVDREKAARFSFLMVVPLIFGKIAMDLFSGDFNTMSTPVMELGIGFVAAFVTGIFACKWMITLVKRSNLKYFSLYCIIIALLVIGYYIFIGV